MRANTKSSITLPPEELRMVLALQARLKAKSKVEVVRRDDESWQVVRSGFGLAAEGLPES